MFIVSDLVGLAVVGWYVRDKVRKDWRVVGIGVGGLFMSYLLLKRVAGYR
jgi:hypothetical protein